MTTWPPSRKADFAPPSSEVALLTMSERYCVIEHLRQAPVEFRSEEVQRPCSGEAKQNEELTKRLEGCEVLRAVPRGCCREGPPGR